MTELSSEDKIKVINDKIDGYRSMIGHILQRDTSIGIDYSDQEEMAMVEDFVLDKQEKIALLESVLEEISS